MAFSDFARFAQTLPEATLLVDGSGVVRAANPACLALLGRSAALVGTALSGLTRDGADAVAALLRIGSRSSKSLPGALVFEIDGAEPIAMRCEIALLRQRDGEHPALLCLRLFDRRRHAGQFVLLNQRIDELSQEIQRRRSAEQRLQAQSEQLLEAGRRKDEFLAMLAHELRNPLAPISLGVDLLQRIEPKHAKVTQVAAMMRRQVSHLTRLVNDLLDLARLSHGKVALQRQPESIGNILTRAIELVRPQADERGLQLHAGGLPLVQLDADGDRLVQVFGNLLGNAVKFCQPGGQITVDARLAGDEVVVSISDDGAGIDAALLPMIFEAFVQDDRSLDRAKGGLGVGLSIVRSLVELHGGRVAGRSDGRDRGAEFIVHLPLGALPAGADAGTASRGPSASGTGLQPLRVLVVEDNGDSAEAMRALVGEWGHEAFAVGNGPDALEHWVGWRADVVLLDIGLPGMSGLQVARRLRELAAGAPLLLVAITGYGSAGDRQASSDAGFDLHLCKPVDLDHLEGVLGAHATALLAARAG